MGVRRGGYPDHFTAEGLDKEAEFRFRIQNQDIIVGGKGDADNFFLGGEGLAGTGNAEAKAVSGLFNFAVLGLRPKYLPADGAIVRTMSDTTLLRTAFG